MASSIQGRGKGANLPKKILFYFKVHGKPLKGLE